MPKSQLRSWLIQSFQKAYRYKKADFKKNFWTERGGEELGHGMRERAPENIRKSEWVKYCDFVMDLREVGTSQRNKVNRIKQTLLSTHVGNSFAQRRWAHEEILRLKISQSESASSNDDQHIVDGVMGMHSGHSRGV